MSERNEGRYKLSGYGMGRGGGDTRRNPSVWGACVVGDMGDITGDINKGVIAHLVRPLRQSSSSSDRRVVLLVVAPWETFSEQTQKKHFF